MQERFRERRDSPGGNAQPGHLVVCRINTSADDLYQELTGLERPRRLGYMVDESKFVLD
jgi:hypothetical protein